MSILLAILGLALLIVLHEAGHFTVARLCGMRVEAILDWLWKASRFLQAR